jgi:hypothetical protein
MSTARPIGVSVLAVLYFIAVAFYAVMLAMFIGSPGTLTAVLNSISPEGVGPSMLLTMGRALTIYFAIMIVVIGAVAWGMWTLKNWARWFTILITAISLGVTVVGVSSLMSSFTIVGLCVELVRIGLCVVILWYLFTPTVRAAFKGNSTSLA